MLVSAFSLAIFSALTAACYSIFLKKSTEKLLFSFWVAVFTCLSMTVSFYGVRLYEGIALVTSFNAMIRMISESYLNYIVVALCIVLSVSLKAHLFHRFNLAKIIPILQIGTPLTALLYFFLGDPLSTHEVIGISILSLGAFISGFERFYFPNILKPLENLPLYLYCGAFLMALLGSIENVIIYLTSQDTNTTARLLNFFHRHGITHFTGNFVTALEYFQMSTFFMVLTFFIYLIFAAKKPLQDFVTTFRTEKKIILSASAANFISQYLYYYIYQNNDQAVMVALAKFSVPLTLALAYVTFKEELHTPELVGVTMIIIGGLIGAF